MKIMYTKDDLMNDLKQLQEITAKEQEVIHGEKIC